MRFEVIYHNQKNNNEYREYVIADDLVHAIDIAIANMRKNEHFYISQYDKGMSAIVLDGDICNVIIPKDMRDDELHAAVDKVNAYYRFLDIAIDNGDDAASDFFIDHYMELIDRYAPMFGYTSAQFEDLCRDVRYFGWDME